MQKNYNNNFVVLKIKQVIALFVIPVKTKYYFYRVKKAAVALAFSLPDLSTLIRRTLSSFFAPGNVL